MKLSKLLILPFLFLATSCISIDNTAKGDIFDASEGVTNEPVLEYYDDNVYGDAILSPTGDTYTLNFKNGDKTANTKLSTSEEAFDAFKETKTIIKEYGLDNIYKGIYGLKINYQKGTTNLLTFNLVDTIKVQYVSIKCSPAFYNNLITDGENAGQYQFVSTDSALKCVKEDDSSTKYVKLKAVEEEDSERNSKKAKEYTVTFDLGKPSSKFSLSTAAYSTVINSITLY